MVFWNGKKLGITIVLITCMNVLSAQSGRLPEFKQITHPFMPALTSEYFYFTSDGLIWFSTARGLTSYDGSEIVYYSTDAQSKAFDLTSIRAIAEDRDNNLYIGTDEFLVYFDRSQQRFSGIAMAAGDKPKNERAEIASIYVDPGNNIVYAGRMNRGLLVYDPGKKKSTGLNLDKTKPDDWRDISYNTNRCFVPHATDSNLLWLGTNFGIYCLNKRNHQLTRSFTLSNPPDYKFKNGTAISSKYGVHKMEIIDDSTVCFNTYGSGIGAYNVSSGNARMYLQYSDQTKDKKEKWPAYVIRSFVKYNADELFLGVFNPSPAIYNLKTNQLGFLRVQSGSHTIDEVRYVDKDRSGNIWVLSRGLLFAMMPEHSRFNRVALWKHPKSDLSSIEFRSIIYDTIDQCYYAAARFTTGVYVFDRNFQFKKLIPTPLFTNRYTNNETCTDWIAKDGNGRLWTTGQETYVLLPGNKKFEHVEKVFPSLIWLRSKGEFSDLKTTIEGNLVFRHSGDGTLYIINCKTLVTDTVKLPDIKTSANYDIYQSFFEIDDQRGLVYSNNRRNIVRYHLSTKKITHLNDSVIFGKTTPRGSYLNYCLDHEGRIWISVEQYGIRILDPITLLCVDSISFGEKGLMRGEYMEIADGGPSHMFFKSASGIVVYNYNSKHSFLFDHSNGLSSPRISRFMYCNNNLVVGQQNSILVYDMSGVKKNKFILQPKLNSVSAAGKNIFTWHTGMDKSEIKLNRKQNTITLQFSSPEFFFPERIEYAYMLEGVDENWIYTQSFNRDLVYANLYPGTYNFKIKAQLSGGSWRGNSVEYIITVIPAWWQTMIFKIVIISLSILFITLIIRNKFKQEQEKVLNEKRLLELEARALRAQMNPHFIFNCMNSIKALIQNNDKQRAIDYLTTFSKLIRTLFQNSDKRQISLYDEIETCRLYTQLEAMRLNGKLTYNFKIDPNLDLKSVMVPALIIQPFIENAVWHGIVPQEEGCITVTVSGNGNATICEVDDDGIGRERSKLNRPLTPVIHESKGVRLSQARLSLEKMLNETNATIDIIDKYNISEPAGTRVTLTFNVQ